MPAASTRSLITSETASLGVNMSMPVDRPEDRAIGDTSAPASDGADRAISGPTVRNADLSPVTFLIGLGSPENDDQALPHLDNVGGVETDELRSAEPARKTEEEERPIPYVLHAVAHGVEHQEQVLLEQRLRLVLRGPVPSLDAPQRGADDLRAARVGEALRSVCLRYGRHAPNQGRDAQRPGVVGQIGCHDQRSGRDNSTPRLELREVGSVGAAGVRENAVRDKAHHLNKWGVCAIDCTRSCVHALW